MAIRQKNVPRDLTRYILYLYCEQMLKSVRSRMPCSAPRHPVTERRSSCLVLTEPARRAGGPCVGMDEDAGMRATCASRPAEDVARLGMDSGGDSGRGAGMPTGGSSLRPCWTPPHLRLKPRPCASAWRPSKPDARPQRRPKPFPWRGGGCASPLRDHDPAP